MAQRREDGAGSTEAGRYTGPCRQPLQTPSTGSIPDRRPHTRVMSRARQADQRPRDGCVLRTQFDHSRYGLT